MYPNGFNPYFLPIYNQFHYYPQYGYPSQGPYLRVAQAEENTLETIYINNVPFPYYIKIISSVIKNVTEFFRTDHIEIPWLDGYMLYQLKYYVSLLPASARDAYGRVVPATNINDETIFVHSLLINEIQNKEFYEGTRKRRREISNHTLGRFFSMAKMLDIRPLIDVSAYFIAQRIPIRKGIDFRFDPSLTYIKDQLEELNFQIVYPAIRLKDIRKYLYLKKINVSELTIADFLGLHGQPKIINQEGTHKVINLARFGLTGLEGIDKLQEARAITILDLADNYLLGEGLDPYFPKDPFVMYENLIELYLSENQLIRLPSSFFNGLSKLTTVHLSENHLTLENDLFTLQNELFNNLSSLRFLDLSSNSIKVLPDGIFSQLNILKEIDLSDNNLEDIKPGIFPLSLEDLNLSDNEIGEIEDGDLQFPQLIKLDLSMNLLEQLSQNAFRNIPTLQELNLKENLLENLPGNLFQSLGNLVVLNLGTNQLDSLNVDLFQGLTNLQILNLNINNLTNQSFPANVFNPLINLQSLKINENYIAMEIDTFKATYLPFLPNVEIVFYPQNVGDLTG